MPDTYYNTLVKGLAHVVPVITGNAQDENGATFGINLMMSEYLSSLKETFGEN
jgi:carboxylesterase 2